MLARFVLGAVTAGAVIAPALAGQMMNADEARRFVAGKVFAFTCFDGTRGAGRVFEDGGAAIRSRSAASPSAPRSGAFRSSRASTSTSKTSGTSADRSRAWVSRIAISVVKAPRRCCWRGRWRDRVRCGRRCGPARWKYPRVESSDTTHRIPAKATCPGVSAENLRVR